MLAIVVAFIVGGAVGVLVTALFVGSRTGGMIHGGGITRDGDE